MSACGIGLDGRLVDDFIDSYVEWREACAELRAAYRRWAGAPPDDRGLAFLAHGAALDWEHGSALVHQQCADELGRHAASRGSRVPDAG
jgi:hypothetical protein